MDIQSWPWTGILGAAAVYWVVLIASWLFYTTRPSTQARARARDFQSAERAPKTGKVEMTFAHSTRLDRVALVLLGPPIVLAALRLIL